MRIASIAVFVLGFAAVAVAGTWSPQAFADASTLEFRTVTKDEPEHWATVWMVVIDGAVYLRLGKRAAARVESHTEAPIVAIRFAGEEFPRVRMEPAPDMAERVGEEMARKYWTDLFVRWVDHPLVVRLVPVES